MNNNHNSRVLDGLFVVRAPLIESLTESATIRFIQLFKIFNLCLRACNTCPVIVYTKKTWWDTFDLKDLSVACIYRFIPKTLSLQRF